MEPTNSRPIAQSRALVGLLLYFALDLALRAGFPYWRKLAMDYHWQEPIWQQFYAYRSQPSAPDIVFFGSSLMLAAIAGSDSDQGPVNLFNHFTWWQLSKNCAGRLGKPVSTFQLASTGQFVSDSYALALRLFCEKKPQLLVYGIAPRDFMDNTLSSALSTEPVGCVLKSGGFVRFPEKALASNEQLQASYMQANFIYGHRQELAHAMGLPAPHGKSAKAVSYSNLDPGQHADNLFEYAHRYNPFKADMFDAQCACLHGLLQFCHERDIRVLLVNMPITAANMKVMPAGFYDRYHRALSTISHAEQAELVDLNDGSFPQRDFYDSVHLNRIGAKLLAERLAEDMQERRIALK